MRASPSKVIAAALAAATLLVTFMVISGGEPPAPDGAGRVADRRDPSARDAEEAAPITSEVSAVDGTDAAARSVAGDAASDPALAVERVGAAQLIGAAVDEAGAPLVGARLLATTRRSSIPLGLEASSFDRADGLTPRSDRIRWRRWRPTTTASSPFRSRRRLPSSRRPGSSSSS